jgi:N utilization substance protein B
MNRTRIRENAFKFLYEVEIQKETNEEQLQLFLDINEIHDRNAVKYIRSTVNGVQREKETILQKIVANLKSDWKIERVSKMNLVILKLSIYEILYTDVPFKVIINEAVELAKVYGEDTSQAFVNGVLASVVNDK